MIFKLGRSVLDQQPYPLDGAPIDSNSSFFLSPKKKFEWTDISNETQIPHFVDYISHEKKRILFKM